MTPPVRATIVAQIEHALITDCQGKQSGDRIMALCQSHDDHNPSMSWSVSKHVWKCFACGAGGGWVDLARLLKIELPKLENPIWTEVARWQIKDFDGNVKGTHIRKELPNGEKRFIWVDHNGVSSKDMPLYGSELIPQFSKYDPVYVTEGAGKCDVLRTLGVQVVATVTGAAAVPSKQVLSVLDGLDVHMWPDNDAAGYSHMQRIADVLPEQPLWINWKNAPPKGDAADFVEQGGTNESLTELVGTADLQPAPLHSESIVPNSLSRRDEELGTIPDEPDISFGFLDAEGIIGFDPPPVEWQLGGRLAVAGLGLLASKPKVGKSQFLLGLALATCRGDNFLTWTTRKGPVLVLAFEGRYRDVVNRLTMMGIRPDDEIHLKVGPPPVFDTKEKSIFDDWLEPLINRFQPVLIIIDTLFRMIPDVADANDYSLVNRALAPLEYLARRTGVSILVSHHANKSIANPEDPGQAILGSTAILGGVDTALLMTRRKGTDGSTHGRELSSIQREGESLDPVIITLDSSSGWPMNAGSAEGFAVEAAKQSILDALANSGELGPVDLAKAVGIKNATLLSARSALIDGGKISERSGGGNKKFFYLSEEQGGTK